MNPSIREALLRAELLKLRARLRRQQRELWCQQSYHALARIRLQRQVELPSGNHVPEAPAAERVEPKPGPRGQ